MRYGKEEARKTKPQQSNETRRERENVSFFCFRVCWSPVSELVRQWMKPKYKEGERERERARRRGDPGHTDVWFEGCEPKPGENAGGTFSEGGNPGKHPTHQARSPPSGEMGRVRQQREVPVNRWTGNCCGIRADPTRRENRRREKEGEGNLMADRREI